MISVCLTHFNGEKYIEEQILSILSQIDINDELIISDDSDSALLEKLILGINDNRVVLIKGPQEGVVKNFENALNFAKGDLIFLADQDDVWFPNKVTICKNALKNYDLILTNCTLTDKDLNPIQDLFSTDPNINFFNVLYKNKFIGSCMAFRKEILKHALPFPSYLPMHDWWIGLLATSKGSVIFESMPLMFYRRHENNITNTGYLSKNSFFKKIIYRLILIYSLIVRLLNKN